MRKIWIVLLVILGIIVIAAGFIVFTIYQAIDLIGYVNQDKIKQDFEALAGGDCGKLPEVESELNDIKGKISSACKNPLLNYVIKKVSGIDICAEVKNPDNEIERALSEAKTLCEQQV